MLSFQRKRRAADQITFECRGHKVEEERLKRAPKRRKRSPPLDIGKNEHRVAESMMPDA